MTTKPAASSSLRSFYGTPPARLFYLFLAVHFALWVLVPTLLSPNAPLDVIEGFAWGHGWPLGTYKHPPLQAWLLESLALLTNRAAFVPYLASQLSVIVAFLGVYRLALRFVGEKEAFLSVFLLEGVLYYNFTTPEFNPNVLQLPFWAWSVFFFHRALRQDRARDWLALGLIAGLGFYAKYSMLVLLGAMGLYMLQNATTRARLLEKGPYLAVFLFLATVAPHLWWLKTNAFLPFSYVQSRLEETPAALWALPRFIGSQALVLLGPLFLTLLLTGMVSWKKPCLADKLFPTDKSFIWSMTFLPFGLVLLFLALSGGNGKDMWGSYLWNLFGLFLILQAPLPQKMPRRFLSFGGTLVVGFLLVYALVSAVGPYYARRPSRIIFPGRALSAATLPVFLQTYSHSPYAVIGDTWLAGNAAYYAAGVTTSDRPQVLIDGDLKISPWIDQERLKKEGGILLWCAGRCEKKEGLDRLPASYKTLFPQAEIKPPLTLQRMTLAKTLPAFVGWAILPPEE